MAAPDPGRERIAESLDETRSRFAMPNDEALVTPLIRRLEGAIFEMGLCDQAELIRVAVALREAIVNAIDHGNLGPDPELRQDDERVHHRLGAERHELSPCRERRVRIDVGATRSEATFTTCDEGPGFDPSTLPDPADPANLLRIGGRGVTLIRTPMDEVRFNAAGNKITLVMRRRAPRLGDMAGQRNCCASGGPDVRLADA
jgi:anti-sigma regulatory factor (Ser/Thr protein kinase)